MHADEKILDVLEEMGFIFLQVACNGSCKKCKVKLQGNVVLACEQKFP